MRPDEVSAWLKNGRKYHAMPLITSIDGFEDAWLKWWAHLQPECRGKWPELSREISEFGVWQELQKGGPNGFFLILLSYCWWGAYRLSSDGDPIEPGHTTWTDIFWDIEWALDQMIADLEHSRKRVREEADNLNGEAENTKPRSKRLVFSTLLVLYTSDEILQAQNLTGCGGLRTSCKGVVRLVVTHVFFSAQARLNQLRRFLSVTFMLYRKVCVPNPVLAGMYVIRHW